MEVVRVERTGCIVRLSKGEYIVSSSQEYPKSILLPVTDRLFARISVVLYCAWDWHWDD